MMNWTFETFIVKSGFVLLLSLNPIFKFMIIKGCTLLGIDELVSFLNISRKSRKIQTIEGNIIKVGHQIMRDKTKFYVIYVDKDSENDYFSWTQFMESIFNTQYSILI